MRQIKRLQIGKKGLTGEFITQIKKIFEEENLLKVAILKSACRDKAQAKEIAENLVDALGKNYKYRLVGYVITINKFRKDVR
jgi:RNA-binding protein YhbY